MHIHGNGPLKAMADLFNRATGNKKEAEKSLKGKSIKQVTREPVTQSKAPSRPEKAAPARPEKAAPASSEKTESGSQVKGGRAPAKPMKESPTLTPGEKIKHLMGAKSLSNAIKIKKLEELDAKEKAHGVKNPKNPSKSDAARHPKHKGGVNIGHNKMTEEQTSMQRIGADAAELARLETQKKHLERKENPSPKPLDLGNWKYGHDGKITKK